MVMVMMHQIAVKPAARYTPTRRLRTYIHTPARTHTHTQVRRRNHRKRMHMVMDSYPRNRTSSLHTMVLQVLIITLAHHLVYTLVVFTFDGCQKITDELEESSVY